MILKKWGIVHVQFVILYDKREIFLNDRKIKVMIKGVILMEV